MDRLPNEVLSLVFDAYLQFPSTLPISLTPVCRRWYTILVSSPVFWFRVLINIRSPSNLPFILESPGLQLYLSRSETGIVQAPDERREIPLDIDIVYHVDKKCHQTICGLSSDNEIGCRKPGCVFLAKSNLQLCRLLTLLGGSPTPATSLLSQTSPPSSSMLYSIPPLQRIKRWRSFSLDTAGLSYRTGLDSIELKPFDEELYQAPILTHIRLSNLLSPYEGFHKSFAPNLRSLEMYNVVMTTIPYIGIIRRMVLVNTMTFHRQIASNLEELTISRGSHSTLNPLILLTKLKTLKIIDSVSDEFLKSLQLAKSDNTGLEVLHLVNLNGKARKSLAGTSLLQYTRQLNFELSPDPDSGSNSTLDPRSDADSADLVRRTEWQDTVDFLSRWCQHMVIHAIGKRAEGIVAAMHRELDSHRTAEASNGE